MSDFRFPSLLYSGPCYFTPSHHRRRVGDMNVHRGFNKLKRLESKGCFISLISRWLYYDYIHVTIHLELFTSTNTYCYLTRTLDFLSLKKLYSISKRKSVLITSHTVLGLLEISSDTQTLLTTCTVCTASSSSEARWDLLRLYLSPRPETLNDCGESARTP